MAIQTINIGNLANDGTGDDLRTAFIKVNNNFTSLDNDININELDGENIGSGSGIFAQKTDRNLQFKTLNAGANISLTESGTSVAITANVGVKQLLCVSDNGTIALESSLNLLYLQGGTNIGTEVINSKMFFNVLGTDLLKLDPAPTLNANLNANSKNITGAEIISSNSFIGDLEGLVYGVDIRVLNRNFAGFDLGGITPIAETLLDFLLLSQDIDMGTFANPYEVSIQGGTFI